MITWWVCRQAHYGAEPPTVDAFDDCDSQVRLSVTGDVSYGQTCNVISIGVAFGIMSKRTCDSWADSQQVYYVLLASMYCGHHPFPNPAPETLLL